MSLFIATPCYGNQVTEPYFRSILRAHGEMLLSSFPHEVFTLGNDSLVTRARNVCASAFCATEYERMLFIDADIEFTTEDIVKLWNLDFPITVGVYPMKKPGSGYAAWRDGKLVEDLDQFDRPITVDYAGTGFMMIKREVFGEIRLENPEWIYEEGQIGESVAYFQDPILDGFHCSEDYFFCRTWRDLGHEVWMDPSVRLVHHGTYGYGSDIDLGRRAAERESKEADRAA